MWSLGLEDMNGGVGFGVKEIKFWRLEEWGLFWGLEGKREAVRISGRDSGIDGVRAVRIKELELWGLESEIEVVKCGEMEWGREDQREWESCEGWKVW